MSDPAPRRPLTYADAGDVPDREMEQVFNLGVGMVAVVPSEDRLDTLDAIRSSGHDAWLIGEIVDGRGKVTIEEV